MKRNYEDYLVYAMLVFALLAVLSVVVTALMPIFTAKRTTSDAMPQSISDWQDGMQEQSRAAAASGDVCAVPAGADPEEWKEHMSHHPDQYPGCV